LEIGCSTGWRLAYLQKKFGAECHGVDPSGDAIRAGLRRHPRLQLRRGTADRLPFGAGQFDLVIFGFCLYLCDRSDLFKIACEADRVLQNNGHLALLDFAPPLPYRNEYQHQPGLCSYKMDYAAMFTWNPAYVPIYHIKISHGGAQGVQAPNDRVGASVLLKRGTEEYPQVVWPA
jgi:ubiquinone/menaquinone biosynthesis C-methylase UbiE